MCAAHPTDDELMARAGQGDLRAFDLLARRHRARLVNFAAVRVPDRELAQDIAQEILLRIWFSANQYRPQGRFLRYLYRIAHRACLRAQQVERRRSGLFDPVSVPAEVADDARCLLANDQPQDVLRALSGLPERYRSALVLTVLHGLTLREAAAQLGCPPGTLASRKSEAVKLLRQRLRAAEHAEGERP